jgi:hypothetical protein
MTDRNGGVSAAPVGGSNHGPTPESDDWESMLDSGRLDRSLDRITIKPRPPPAAEEQNSGGPRQQPILLASRSGPARPLMSDPFFEGAVPAVRILTHDGNAARTQYRPPEQQLKILKRPSAADTGGQAGKPSENQPGVRITQWWLIIYIP